MSLSATDGANLRIVFDEAEDAAGEVSAQPAATAVEVDVADDGGRLVGASLALALLRSIREAAYVMDCDGRVTFINTAGLGHLGQQKQPHRLVGGYLWDLWPEAPVEVLRDAVAEARDGDPVLLDDIDCPGVGGVLRRAEVSISPVEDAGGRVSKLLVLVREA